MTDAQWLLSEFLDLSHATQHEYAVGDQADQYEANRKRAEAIIARLAAAEAERDAAVARLHVPAATVITDADLPVWRSGLGIGYDSGFAEGQRRATAAIVADLRKAPRFHEIEHDLSDRYESGDHLKAPK